MKNKINSRKIYFIYIFLVSLFLTVVFTSSSLYQINNVGLNPLQLIIVGTVLESTCFIFEIPTGILADLYSRKLSIIIGVALIGIAFVVMGSIEMIWTVMLSQFLWGVGFTFISGSDIAWISNELKGENIENVFLKGMKLEQISSVLGVIIGVYLGNFNLNIPIIFGGVGLLILAIYLYIFMDERPFEKIKRDELSNYEKMFATFKEGLKHITSNKVLSMLLIVAIFYGLHSEGFDRLWIIHLVKDIGIPKNININEISYVGIVNIVAALISIFLLDYVDKKLEKKNTDKKIILLFVFNLVTSLSICAFAFSINFICGITFYWISIIFTKLNAPLYNAIIVRNSHESYQATIISTYGQINSLGQIIGGPVIGYIATKFSVGYGLAVTSFMLLVVVFIYLFMSISKIK
ncbi:MFS transporter [Clostridium sp. Marseille-Q7071]